MRIILRTFAYISSNNVCQILYLGLIINGFSRQLNAAFLRFKDWRL